MSIEVNLDSKSPHIWSDSSTKLEEVLHHLRDEHGMKRHSIIMKDVERGGFLFFIYEKIKQEWLSEW